MFEPLLSVCIITYNHCNYIKEAIDGALQQKVNYSWELVIADDFSTDGTREIILEYQNKYPAFIKLILQEKNVGPAKNWVDLINYPKSKYIAYCEGDDYWIAPYKLQRQVGFLEENPEFFLCFHNAMIKHEGVKGRDRLFCDIDVDEITTISDVIEGWYIPSASMVFRRKNLFPLPGWFCEIHNGDYALQLLLSNNGKIKFFKDVMSVYRRNPGALSNGVGRNYVLINNEIIKLLNYFNTHTKFIHTEKIEKKILFLKKQNRYLEIRKKYPIYKYLNLGIWFSKAKAILRIE